MRKLLTTVAIFVSLSACEKKEETKTPTLALLSGKPLTDVAEISFGNVGKDATPATMTYTITGSGLGSAPLSLVLEGSQFNEFSVSTPTVASKNGTIPAKVITVTFNPSSTGKKSATITHSGAGLADPVVLNLSGTGTGATDPSSPIWSSEFDGTELDLAVWNYETGYGNNNDGWGNEEWQQYTDKNVEVTGGNLVIHAKNESGRLGKRDGSITSSRITTEGKFEFEPGTRVEARIKLPWGQGIWPAFWALGVNFSSVGWPACGEIDILEMVGGNPLSHEKNKTVHSTMHWGADFGSRAMFGKEKKVSEPLTNDFHIYELIWTDNDIEMKIDKERIVIVSIGSGSPSIVRSIFHEPFFFILNIAVGGRWPGDPNSQTQFPQTMLVDYIRVYANP